MSLHNTLTFSGLQRYVRIAETVFESGAFLSAGDRAALIQDLVHGPGNPSVAEVEAACEARADQNLEHNMIAARVVSSYYRGGM